MEERATSRRGKSVGVGVGGVKSGHESVIEVRAGRISRLPEGLCNRQLRYSGRLMSVVNRGRRCFGVG
jgi:hypothetical protein